jgi:hypothetical protein
MTYRFLRPGLVVFAALILPYGAASATVAASGIVVRSANVDITGTVTDSTNGAPLSAAEISVSAQAGGVVANTTTDAFGRYRLHNIAPGTYSISAHFLGFRAITRPLTVSLNATEAQTVNFAMTPIGQTLAAVEVTATVPVTVDTRTGDQIFKQNDYHGAPTQTTSQILQQSIVGAARAPTGEVHIRGQHAEYTYYIDGVPVAPGISGSFNELFDPEVVNQIQFQTGGWDAEYGGRNAAIVNVTTKIPAGGFHGSVSSYAGQFSSSSTDGARDFNGQSLSASTNSGPWGTRSRRRRVGACLCAPGGRRRDHRGRASGGRAGRDRARAAR